MVLLCACGAPAAPSPEPAAPERYTFASRFDPAVSSVSHGEATLHQVIVQDLVELAGVLTFRVDARDRAPFQDVVAPGEVVALFEHLFAQDVKRLAGETLALSTSPAALQSRYGDLSDTGASLAALATYAPATDHRNWSAQFVGFADVSSLGGTVRAPIDLVRAIFAALERNAIARSHGMKRSSPLDPEAELPAHFTDRGIDLQALLAAVLGGVIPFRQAADHYLDEEVDADGRCKEVTGLCADNNVPVGEQPYTALEHHWDLGFGYFGASASYGEYSAQRLVRGPRFADDSGDGRIDLSNEYNFGASVLTGIRDGSSPVPIELKARAWRGFLEGRFLITEAGGALLDEERTLLVGARDDAMRAWSEVIAATVVHHLNDTINTVCVCGDADYTYDHSTFLEHGTTWSLAKGWAMALQLDPRSPLSAAEVVELHRLIGDAPVQWLGPDDDAAIEAYRAGLLQARSLIGSAYGFDAQNLGDDNGEHGW